MHALAHSLMHAHTQTAIYALTQSLMHTHWHADMQANARNGMTANAHTLACEHAYQCKHTLRQIQTLMHTLAHAIACMQMHKH